MRVLSIHVIREDDNLDHIRVDGLAENGWSEFIDERSQVIHVPTITVFVRFSAHIKRNPAVRLVEGKDAHILEVGGTSACPNSDSCRRVGVIRWER